MPFIWSIFGCASVFKITKFGFAIYLEYHIWLCQCIQNHCTIFKFPAMSNVPEPENILLLKTIANQREPVGYFQPHAAAPGHSRTHHIWCAALPALKGYCSYVRAPYLVCCSAHWFAVVIVNGCKVQIKGYCSSISSGAGEGAKVQQLVNLTLAGLQLPFGGKFGILLCLNSLIPFAAIASLLGGIW